MALKSLLLLAPLATGLVAPAPKVQRAVAVSADSQSMPFLEQPKNLDGSMAGASFGVLVLARARGHEGWGL